MWKEVHADKVPGNHTQAPCICLLKGGFTSFHQGSWRFKEIVKSPLLNMMKWSPLSRLFLSFGGVRELPWPKPCYLSSSQQDESQYDA